MNWKAIKAMSFLHPSHFHLFRKLNPFLFLSPPFLSLPGHVRRSPSQHCITVWCRADRNRTSGHSWHYWWHTTWGPHQCDVPHVNGLGSLWEEPWQDPGSTVQRERGREHRQGEGLLAQCPHGADKDTPSLCMCVACEQLCCSIWQMQIYAHVV